MTPTLRIRVREGNELRHIRADNVECLAKKPAPKCPCGEYEITWPSKERHDTPAEIEELVKDATRRNMGTVGRTNRINIAIAKLHRRGFSKSDDTGWARASAYAKLLRAVERIGHDENTSYLACPGPPHCDKSHYPTCPVQIAREAHQEAEA